MTSGVSPLATSNVSPPTAGGVSPSTNGNGVSHSAGGVSPGDGILSSSCKLFYINMLVVYDKL